MIIRPLIPHASLPVALLLLSTLVSAQFNCHVNINSLNFDLTKLAGEHTATRTRTTPPSTMVDTLRFDLCADLKSQDGVPEGDQCASGTRACFTKVNKKDSQTDRVVAVIAVVQSSSLNPQSTALSSPKGLELIFQGPSYPSSPSASPIPQSLNLTLLCAETASGPTFTSYNGSMVDVEWSHPAGCGVGDSSGGSGDENKGGEKRVGSGIGWFFLVLLLAIIAYFALGAYYNYSTYGASGVDLIPHRDFWQEVPYMARDVLSHLCSSVRPRRTSARGGYIAV